MSKDILQRKRILTKASSGSSISTPVSVANGGTGLSSYTVGDLIYASGATTLSKLADVATGNALISGGVGTAPSWGKIGLTTHITGGNWKTIYTNGSGVVTELALGSSGQVLQSNGASSAPTWVTPSSGITVGTTTISSGTTGSVLMDIGGVVTESISYRANVNTSFGALNLSYYPTSGAYNSVFGYDCGQFISSGSYNTYFGANIASGGTTSGTANTAVGSNAFGSIGAGNYNTGIGYNVSVGSNSSSIVIGNRAIATASHQGVLAANDPFGYVDNWYFNGVTYSSAYSVVLNASGGSGTNNAGANLTLAAGKSTGSATPAVINFQSTAAGASSSTAQTLATVLQITNSTTITTSDAVNYALGSTTGTKWGTATTQKIGFWGVTPVTQYATTGTTTGFTANASANTLFNESTFTGDTGATAYTISDLVKALKLCGIILA